MDLINQIDKEILEKEKTIILIQGAIRSILMPALVKKPCIIASTNCFNKNLIRVKL